jgi:Tfp pilus assembly protein FimT
MVSNAAFFNNGRSSERGVSLIEGVVVFCIISVVLAFSIPALSRTIKAYNLRSAASHMAERMTAVRALAMAKNKNVTFSLNRETGRYGFDFTGPEGDGVPDTSDPDDLDHTGNYYFETLPSDIVATFPNNDNIKISFNSRGEMPIGSVEKVIALQSYGGNAGVRVNLRGRVTVE